MLRLSLTKQAFILLLILLIVTLTGLIRLLETFGGDQALFVVYAAEINRGALLYRDIWDLKQPGIFLFYLMGGKLFGFSEFGIHLFELIYWLIFSTVLSITLKDYFRRPVFALLTPLLTMGVYYAVCNSWHLTQVEGLVGFPLYLTLLTSAKAMRTSGKFTNAFLLFLSGLAGSIVLIFKLILLPIITLFWLTFLIFLVTRQKNSFPKVLFLVIVPILFGLAIPLIGLFIYFASRDALEVVNYTFFEYPALAIIAFAGENRLEVLKQGLQWFIIVFSPLIILVFIQFLISVKNLKTSNESFLSGLREEILRMDFLTLNLILWLVAGFGIILVQQLSWWEYHYLLLLVPLGILATKGIESLSEQATKNNAFFTKLLGRGIFIIAIILLFMPTLFLEVRRIKNSFAAKMNFPIERLLSPDKINNEYEHIESETAFLFEQNSRPGKIFVCGQPLYYYLSKRSPAVSVNGWMPELFLPEQWKQLNEEIAAKSPVYILTDDNCRELMAKKSPEMLQLLEKNYRLLRRGKDAFWYELVSKP